MNEFGVPTTHLPSLRDALPFRDTSASARWGFSGTGEDDSEDARVSNPRSRGGGSENRRVSSS